MMWIGKEREGEDRSHTLFIDGRHGDLEIARAAAKYLIDKLYFGAGGNYDFDERQVERMATMFYTVYETDSLVTWIPGALKILVVPVRPDTIKVIEPSKDRVLVAENLLWSINPLPPKGRKMYPNDIEIGRPP